MAALQKAAEASFAAHHEELAGLLQELETAKLGTVRHCHQILTPA
jgi:hypothetical protein